MARKETQWPAPAERKFKRLALAGVPAAEIAAQLTKDGVPGASRSTVDRRVRKLIGTRRASSAAASPSPPASSPSSGEEIDDLDDIPDDPDELAAATPHDLDVWIMRANQTYERALKMDNLAVQVTSIGKAKELLDAKRKASPPPPVDLNAAPDMIASAERCVTMLFKKVERATGGRA